MTAAMKAAFDRQAQSCAALGSDFMARLMPVVWQAVQNTPGAVADKVLTWQGDVSSDGASVPLRLSGGLHALVLRDADAKLKAVYPPNDARDDALLAAVSNALTTHADHMLHWLDSPPQTNEVRRSVALIAGTSWITAQVDLPLVLSELGASAGLNLHFDAYACAAKDTVLGDPNSLLRFAPNWTGPVAPAAALNVVDRAGVDLNPLDPSDPDQALRLMAYLWPDQPERAHLTRTAIEMSQTRPATGDAAAWLEDRLTTAHPGCLHLIYHTIAWQYFPASTVDRCTRAIAAAGARATFDAPIAHLSMEADGGKGAALTVKLWPGGTDQTLARVDFHGRWIDWLVA